MKRFIPVMPPVAFLVGLLVAALAAVLVTRAMRTNAFFSAVVRIQRDRGRHVVTGGPYARRVKYQLVPLIW